MPTIKEIELMNIIDDLQDKMQAVTMHMGQMQEALLHAGNNPPMFHMESFTGVADVWVNVPFYVMSPGCDVTVMVEESPGLFRMATPIVQISGNAIQISFDMPKSGYLVVKAPECPAALNLPCPPTPYYITAMDYSEPESEPVVEIETSPAVESVDDSTDNYERAMGLIE